MKERTGARERHARGEGAPSPLACLLRARPFFLVPTTSKPLLGRLKTALPTSPFLSSAFLFCLFFLRSSFRDPSHYLNAWNKLRLWRWSRGIFDALMITERKSLRYFTYLARFSPPLKIT